ncbi:MAG: 50S ribosomal protein L32 [Candidatus Andersenbacteria bacterium CG10_big_fil_rev_8_21_14_0_10_54_11]|uniref:Large ribosomal subunit protein bL32 n=1 Tax=Candidatus Andersenbacteria bacterium CG10_big_fil_rev_8_21_14_0_10_54_11 TaxID=1974485 RepID=A0A2M6WZN5_9BACT|nr:MAG: 50S ribosomal protein L32 [Candidatus Andersenbacteria bacterium CG10_big_fil_rev_8_21_14_0_10_54_11]
MAVPKKRTAPSKRDHRRSHHAAKPVQLAACQRCQAPVRPHTACPNCGTYRGREVIDVMKKLDKRQRKAKEKELEKAGSR